MREKGYNHSNLKPEIIYFFPCEQNENKYILKLLDFELLAKLQYTAYTPAFFNSPMRDYNSDGIFNFKNAEEKFKN
jgi:hypothetical protein